MTSLLQHHGCTTKQKPGYIELLVYLVDKDEPSWTKYNGLEAHKPNPNSTSFTKDREPITFKNGRTAPRLYRIWRRPVGMFGCWVVFRYLGQEHVPDLSVPIAVFKLPRGAECLTMTEMENYWFNEPV